MLREQAREQFGQIPPRKSPQCWLARVITKPSCNTEHHSLIHFNRIARIAQVRWTPVFGPLGKLWFCGSDRPRNDQTYECKSETQKPQHRLQSEGGNGSPDGHQDRGSDCPGVQRTPRASKPMEDGDPKATTGVVFGGQSGHRGQRTVGGRSASKDWRADGGFGLLEKKVQATGTVSERRELVEPTGKLSLRQQCDLLGLARSSLYYEARPETPENLALMRRLDELHLRHPVYGSRRLGCLLALEGQAVNRKRVVHLLRQMGIEAIYPKGRTSQPGEGHRIYPYLLKGLTISGPFSDPKT